MDVNRGPAGAGSDQAAISWQAAKEMALRWLSPDNSSLEARVLTHGGVRLLQAVIYELRLLPDQSDVALSTCYSFLAEEQIIPGSVIARLLSSKVPEVVSVAEEVQSRGEGWVVTETPQKNLIVLTALMNLPIGV
jgi:hypothetical protein